jgi:hypothetical protein
MNNTPEVESLQKNNYFVHSKTITAGYWYHQINYCKQFINPEIVKLVPTDQGVSDLPLIIGFNNF